MAEVGQMEEDKTIEKAVWGIVGTAVLWIGLVLSGIAIERLGLTSGLLSGVLPGETGSLRNQIAECQNNLKSVNQKSDEMMRAKQALEVEVSRLKKAAAPATP
ncbi:MAG TPA: hypothetical protein VNN62_12840 [Methylomirabilota bacterium]|nr:hypothetical protein [Methylomirabilota bacterium]